MIPSFFQLPPQTPSRPNEASPAERQDNIAWIDTAVSMACIVLAGGLMASLIYFLSLRWHV